MKLSQLTDDELERIVMEEFARAERNGFVIARDCEVSLARMVAVRLRKVAREDGQ